MPSEMERFVSRLSAVQKAPSQIVDTHGMTFTRQQIESGACMAYDNKTLLVPGVPEAPDDIAAMEAFEKWIRWLGDPHTFKLKSK